MASLAKQKTMINDLTNGPLGRQLLLFSLPLILSNILHSLYNLVDMVVVGRFAGKVGLSAIATASTAIAITYCFGIGIASGSQILISQQVGRKEKEGIETTFNTTFRFTLFSSVLIAALVLLLRIPILRLLNTPEEAWEEALSYFFWCGIGIPFNYLNSCFGGLLRGLGNSRQSAVFVAVSAFSNVLLDLLLVAVFHMGATGAAMATSFAQFLGVLCCFVFLFRNRVKLGLSLHLTGFRMDGSTVRTILCLSAPMMAQTMAVNLSLSVVNAWVNAFGVVMSALSGIGLKIVFLTSVVAGGFESGMATFAGQNFAAGNLERIRKGLRLSTLVSTAFSCMLGLLFYFFPCQLIGLFTREGEVLAFAPSYVLIHIVMQLTFAVSGACTGFISGIGNVRLNLIIALADGVIARLGLSYLLGHILAIGPFGFWWGNALAGFVTVLWSWTYYFSGTWKKRCAVLLSKN